MAHITGELPLDVANSVALLANQAFVDAMRIGVLAGIGIVALTIVIALLTMPRRMRASQAELDDIAHSASIMTVEDGALQPAD